MWTYELHQQLPNVVILSKKLLSPKKDARQIWGGKKEKKNSSSCYKWLKTTNNKQKSNDISPATNQPKQKIVNQNVNPATNQLHEPEGTILQECSSDQQKPQINLNNNNTPEDSDDSQRLQIDESDSNVAKDLFKDNESITTLI